MKKQESTKVLSVVMQGEKKRSMGHRIRRRVPIDDLLNTYT
jgi:hypothetical protein